MTGREVSVLSFVDGKTIKIMTSAQDHKRAGDGDTGLNTGGMGTFSPSPFYTPEVDAFCKKYIYQAYGRCHGSRRQNLQRNHFLRADADGGWAESPGIQCTFWGSGNPGCAAQDEEQTW